MIDDFDNLKKQLSELADVVNRFKSESVQLRMVELILDGDHVEKTEAPAAPVARKRRRKTSSTASARQSDSSSKTTPKKNGAARSGSGAVSTLMSVHDKGFFKTPRVIGDIVSHCEVNLARKMVTFQPFGWVSFFGGRGGIVPVFEYSLNAARIVSRGWWLRSRKVRKTDISTDWVRAPRSLWLQ